MNANDFRNNVVAPLLKFSNIGNTLSETGTQLIGHMPEIAPKAFKHSIYKALTKDELNEFRQRIGTKEIPAELEEFLLLANGLMLFNGEIRVFGYVPIERKVATKIHNYPPNIMVSNSSLMELDLFAVGWYESDQSNVFLLNDGCIVRTNQDGDIIAKWENMERWLCKEISRLSIEMK